MEISIFNDINNLYKTVAQIVVNQVNSHPFSTLCLPTGNTYVPFYKLLVNDYVANKTNYNKVVTFNLDEYVGLDKNNKNSFYSYMQEMLFKHININPLNTHLLNGQATNLQLECNNYNQLLQANPINITLLGLGVNGHIGFNEPSKKFSEYTHIVNLSQSTIQANASSFSSGSVPHQALTMGIKNILASKQIILVATGAKKAQAVVNMIEKSVTPNCPASVLQTHPNVLVLLDTQAGSGLSQSTLNNCKII